MLRLNCSDTPRRSTCNKTIAQYTAPVAPQTSTLWLAIHYSNSPCRRKNMRMWYHTNTRKLQFVSHFDAEFLPLPLVQDCVAKRFCGDPGELTQASCALKHAASWHIAAQNPSSHTIVVEDDMRPRPEFFKSLRRAIHSLPRNWELFNFGCPGPRRMTPGPHFCSRGYALTRNAAKKLARDSLWIDTTCDGLILRASSRLRSYRMTLPLHHGSVLGDGPLMRGYDLCANVTSAKTDHHKHFGVARTLRIRAHFNAR